MEDNTVRAITIAVGVLISIATISLVVMYYNTAKESFSAIGRGNDLNTNYNKHVVDILTKSEARGTDITNILNYFENNPSITLNVYDKDGNESSVSTLRNTVKPNEKFIITVNNSSATDITIEALD